MLGAVRGLAASGTAVVAFFVAAVLPAATWPFIDGDVWWHLRAGEEVLATGTVPRADSWSILAQGTRWISQDWLSNTTMAAIRGVGPLGETVLSFVFGLVVVAAFVVLWRTVGVRNPTAGWAPRLVWLTVGLVLAAPVLGVRVQVLDLLLCAATVWLLARYLADRRRRWIVAVPILAIAWANLHAGWPMLFALGGATVLGEGIDRLWKRAVAPEPLAAAQLRDLAIGLVAAFGGLAVNPNGTDLWTYPLNPIFNAAIGRFILEWFPVTVDPRLLAIYIGFVTVAVIPTLALGRHTLRMADVLVVIGLTIMAGYSVRFLLIAGPLVAVIAAVNLTPRLAATRMGRWAGPIIERLSVPRRGWLGIAHLALAAGLMLLGVGVSLAKVTPGEQAAAAAQAFPVGAVAWLEAHDGGKRAFNRYEWGGYLILQRPEALVFIDGRAQDVYSEDQLTLYAAIISVQRDLQVEFDRYAIDHVVFPPGNALANWLDASPGWERAYEDPVAVVWVRR